MKIIFLDIDGVLNHQLWFESILGKPEFKKERPDDYKRWFCPSSVELLNDLTTETGAKIVLSSSWRKGRSVEQIQKLLRDNGILGEVIDKTPFLRFTGVADYNYSVPRGCEIKAWLELNKDKLGSGIGNYKTYVIFDDDSDMLWWQRNNYVQIDGHCGITPNTIYKAKNILNNDNL